MADPTSVKSLSNVASQRKLDTVKSGAVNVASQGALHVSNSVMSQAQSNTQDKGFSANRSVTKVKDGARDVGTSKSSAAKIESSFIKIIAGSAKAKEEEKYVTDPDFNKDFIESIDRHVKLMLLAMMFLATLIWGVFFYAWFHLPNKIFAHKEIERVFLPSNYWSGVYWQIACPWAAGLYCLVVVVYPDPRKWRFCLSPRRTWRWIPYILPLAYTVVVCTYWFYCLFLIPGNLKLRMIKIIKNSLNNVTNSFPSTWEYVHNYYQCCGIESKVDWSNKLIPKKEIPYPFKSDKVCTSFYYGYHRYSDAYHNCSEGNFSALGVLWPASCCDNYSGHGCQILPSNTQVWKGQCHVYEMALGIGTVITAMLLTIGINVLGVFVFFKTRILESAALREKLKPPKPHI
ncbi:unnamed protein product [Allacma fusca]|uniref:Uncharacterized protein n=1 Tax=Allacma fusca TaxID=39272 RepID=A0A8J2LR55_9HEXA|nr:unnamed protein product [Allacma fusca]